MENLETIFKNIVKNENAILLNQIKKLVEADPKNTPPEIMNFEQCKELLNCSDSYLYKKTSTNAIPHAKKGKRLFFERSKIIKWLLENQVKTIDEIEAETDEFLLSQKKGGYNE